MRLLEEMEGLELFIGSFFCNKNPWNQAFAEWESFGVFFWKEKMWVAFQVSATTENQRNRAAFGNVFCDFGILSETKKQRQKHQIRRCKDSLKHWGHWIRLFRSWMVDKLPKVNWWVYRISEKINSINMTTLQGINISHLGKFGKSSTQKWFLMGYVSSLKGRSGSLAPALSSIITLPSLGLLLPIVSSARKMAYPHHRLTKQKNLKENLVNHQDAWTAQGNHNEWKFKLLDNFLKSLYSTFFLKTLVE